MRQKNIQFSRSPASLLPLLTWVIPSKYCPVMATGVPPCAALGETEEMAGVSAAEYE